MTTTPRFSPRAHALLVLALLVALGPSVPAAVSWGAAEIPVADTARFFWAALTGGAIPAADFTDYTVVLQIRTPRVLLAAVVGAGLSALDIAAQAMVRNPLADPFILGISSGAAVGASAVVSWGLFAALGGLALSAAAFLGALAASALVYLLSRTPGGVAPVRLILTGVVLSFGFQALMSAIVFFDAKGDAARTVMFWMLGSLGAATWQQLPLPVAATALCLAWLAWRAQDLDTLSMGDGSAASLGVDPDWMRVQLFALTVLGTATLVSVAGTIGFVGLVVPHATRIVLGPAHRRAVVVAPLVGALFIVWVDLLSRVAVPPRELPLGVVTALIGVPVFLVLMRRAGYVFGGSR
ncbi:iron ABC transporter permease [Kocuria rhizophila]|uniref:FecCD family ABC transporter permease n=1 Tax=Kocuria rhizophila TaxID=72000 RepID=UPI0021501E96|nr:iron ABC transporter permease [Kocuria rhizophila]MCR4526364.1 iron ABC transporter permease [Kocuria rhizophila]